METWNCQRYQKDVKAALTSLAREKVVSRIWKKDWTVWKTKPDEIVNRLGWLTCPWESVKILPQAQRLAQEIRRERYQDALLLGMGGSSLAPLVLEKTFQTKPGFLGLTVLDSTVPGAIQEVTRHLNPRTTLFIVSSKSGTTAETAALFSYFWNLTAESLGEEKASRHFIAITDESTPLAGEARRLGFRSLFLGDPEIGGRFSALSLFGLVPSSLKGIDGGRLLKMAREMAVRCQEEDPVANPGAYLGTLLAVMADKGKDKMTFLLSPRLQSFGLWLEQLIAESTGKEGKGIVPVEGEPPGPPRVYGSDRFFVHLSFGRRSSWPENLLRWKRAGFPILSLHLPTCFHLGAQFFLWEFSIAVAGHFLGVNPFDQPDVDLTKKKTRQFLDSYREKKRLSEESPCLTEGNISLFLEGKASSLAEGVQSFLSQARSGDYVGIQAFVDPTGSTRRALQELRVLLRDKTGLAVTVGFGPRYLHSTGQLHKGDSGRGLFIQLTADPDEDLPVPDAPGSSEAALTFGVLSMAQALGDGAALKAADRRLLRLHIHGRTEEGLVRIISLLRKNK